MASFFEKLKKGMGVEKPAEELTEDFTEEPIEKEKIKKNKKTRTSPKRKTSIAPSVKEKPQEAEEKPTSIEEKEEPKVKEKPEREIPLTKTPTAKEKWSTFGGEPEGQLAIDVYQTNGELIIQSAIAGIKPEELDISIEGDVVTIKGIREKPNGNEEKNYFYQECYWGPFSRELILPEEVDPSRAEAEMKEGILTIKIPKIQRLKKRKIAIKA